MNNNSILIISNDKNVGTELSDKIKLLRECDTIKVTSFIESISVLNSTQPSIIILYCSRTDSTGILKEIRSIKTLDKVPIIFVMDNLVEDILFYAFDNGIDDFFFLNDSDSIILMRIFLTLQKSVLYKQIDINNQILVSANILDKNTGIYKKEQANIVLRNFFSKSIEENLENTVFMYVKANVLDKKRIDMNKVASVVRTIPRGDDIVAFGKGTGLYLILYNSGINGARSVAKRIKKALEKDCVIHINAAEITTSFEEMESVLYQSMKKQIEDESDFVYIDNINKNILTSPIEAKDEKGKKFKDFKQEFYKSFEKIVAPVFYQAETTLNEKYPDAKVKFNMTENESTFEIEQNKFKSELCITYPTYIKVIVDIRHNEEGNSPVIRRLIYDFEDFSEEKLSSLIVDMSNEFAERLSLSTMTQAE